MSFRQWLAVANLDSVTINSGRGKRVVGSRQVCTSQAFTPIIKATVYDSEAIHLNVRRLKPGHREAVEAWLAELNGPRRHEAIETLQDEGVSHESAVILDTSDGPVIVYAMETDDIERARAAGAASTHPVDERHHEVMRAADAGPASCRLVLSLTAD